MPILVERAVTPGSSAAPMKNPLRPLTSSCACARVRGQTFQKVAKKFSGMDLQDQPDLQVPKGWAGAAFVDIGNAVRGYPFLPATERTERTKKGGECRKVVERLDA